MKGWTSGDLLFIILVLLLIFGLMALANRSRRHRPAADPSFPDPGAGDQMLRRILKEYRTVAMIGASPEPGQVGHEICNYLLEAGFDVFPCTPAAAIPDRGAYICLAELPHTPQIVLIFRASDAVPELAREAVAAGAKVLWLQTGVISTEAMRIARQGGLTVVMNHCIMQEHRRLLRPVS